MFDTLMVFLKDVFEKIIIILKKSTDKKACKITHHAKLMFFVYLSDYSHEMAKYKCIYSGNARITKHNHPDVSKEGERNE